VVTYRGKNSTAGITQTLALWNWTTSTWFSLGSSAAGTTEVETVTSPIASPAAFIGKGSFSGQMRVQVVSERTSGAGPFFTSGDLMKVNYEAP
jgi:hypothetical protein